METFEVQQIISGIKDYSLKDLRDLRNLSSLNTSTSGARSKIRMLNPDEKQLFDKSLQTLVGNKQEPALSEGQEKLLNNFVIKNNFSGAKSYLRKLKTGLDKAAINDYVHKIFNSYQKSSSQ